LGDAFLASSGFGGDLGHCYLRKSLLEPLDLASPRQIKEKMRKSF
jgi:hypothetical protein